MHNNFGRDEFRVVPSQGDVRAVSHLGQAFEQITSASGWASKSPEVGRTLEGHANHVATDMGPLDWGRCVVVGLS